MPKFFEISILDTLFVAYANGNIEKFRTDENPSVSLSVWENEHDKGQTLLLLRFVLPWSYHSWFVVPEKSLKSTRSSY